MLTNDKPAKAIDARRLARKVKHLHTQTAVIVDEQEYLESLLTKSLPGRTFGIAARITVS